MNFGFLAFDDFEELDLIGPWEIINVWRQYADGPQVCSIVSESGGPVTAAKGLRIEADCSFADCPALNHLLIPGGQGARREAGNPNVLDFIRRQSASCKHLLSVCTGAFLLHAAGLLEGRRATTHWASLDRLRDAGGVEVVEQRWMRDGRIWTAAGVSAGIDLALAFIAETAGKEAAGVVQLAAEYYPQSITYNLENLKQTPAYVAKEQ